MLADLDDTLAGQVLGDERAAQTRPGAGAVPLEGGQLGGDDGWDVVEGVHLAVLVRQRGADLSAVVLERHHIRPPVAPQRGGLLAEHRHHRRQLPRRQLCRAHDVLVGVGDDERPPARRRQAIVASVRGGRVDGDGRVAVVEDGNLVGSRQLGAAGTQRADRMLVAARRCTGTDVAGGRHEHPRVGETVEAAVERGRVERRAGGGGQVPVDLAAVDVEGAAVGMAKVAAGQCGAGRHAGSQSM